MLSIIAAIGKNRELGKDNTLLWHIPGDLPRFKTLTMGHPVIMGRKTYESIGKPLSGRTNIVISKNPSFRPEGVILAPSLEEAIRAAEGEAGAEEIFIIGGGSVYAQAIERAARLYLTVVDKEAEADTFFPSYDRFGKVLLSEAHEENGMPYTFSILEI